MPDNSPRLISVNEVCAMTSMSRTWINHLRSTGQFPRAVPLGQKRFAFVRTEIESWIRDRIAARGDEAA